MRRRLFGVSACALLALSTSPSAARADRTLPYKGAVLFVSESSVPSPDGTMLYVIGRLAGAEVPVGRVTGQIEYLVDLTTGAFTGNIIKRTADGQVITQTLDGQFTQTGSVGTLSFVGGTG